MPIAAATAAAVNVRLKNVFLMSKNSLERFYYIASLLKQLQI